LVWQTKLLWGVLIFFAKKFIFHFLNAKNGLFCEAPTKNMFQKWTNKILNDIVPYFMPNSPVLCMQKVI
jgi:hypothetical protein